MRERLYPKPRRTAKVRGPWSVDYELAYDGGYSKWTGTYPTERIARICAWWNVKIASWGGTAILNKPAGTKRKVAE